MQSGTVVPPSSTTSLNGTFDATISRWFPLFHFAAFLTILEIDSHCAVAAMSPFDEQATITGLTIEPEPSRQATTLANAVIGFAANCDKLDNLGDAVPRMVHKHVSLDIRTSHYPIVENV